MWQDVLMVLWATRVLHWGADTLLDFKVQVGHSIDLTDVAGHIPSVFFQAYFWLLYNGSQLLILPLLSQKLKMPNMTIASLSSVSRVAYFGILAIATEPWLLYLAAGLNSLAGLQGILIR